MQFIHFRMSVLHYCALQQLKTDMCKVESSQKDESVAKQADSSQACYEARTCFIITSTIVYTFLSNRLHYQFNRNRRLV